MSHTAFKTKASSMLTTCYVDIQTLDGNARRLYSGDSCSTPFTREVEKSSWFTTMWSQMKQQSSTSDEPVWMAHKSADFLMKAMLRATVPATSLKKEYRDKGYQIAYTPYMGHNIIEKVSMNFNDLHGPSFDNVFLDMHANLFTDGYDRWILYNKMVGNKPEVVEFSDAIPSFDVKVMLPFTFGRSTSDALKLCCMKGVDTRFSAQLNTDLGTLLRVRRPASRNKDGKVTWEYLSGDNSEYVEFDGKSGKNDKLKNVELWGKYAVVTDEERDFHKEAESHTMVVERVLNYDHSSSKECVGEVEARMHWNGAVKAFMFGAVNLTARKYNYYSNYTTNAHDARMGQDPIKTVSLQYDSNYRYQNFPADMFSEVELLDSFRNRTPDVGHHGSSYSVDAYSTNPGGATVYDRLISTVTVDIEDRPLFSGDERDLKMNLPNEYKFVMRGITETAYLIEGGTVKIPVGDYDN